MNLTKLFPELNSSPTTALMVPDLPRLSIQFSPYALSLKATILESAQTIVQVQTAEDQNGAVCAQRRLAELLRQIEKARKEAKQAPIEYGRAIDKAAHDFTDQLSAEAMRIGVLVANFQEAERIRVAAQSRLAQAELTKLEREKAEALSQAQTVEEQDRIAEDFSEQARAIHVPAPARTEGQRIVKDWDIQVSDIWLLARAHPGCVKIEPRHSEIKALLNAGVKVAGVMAKEVTKAGVRLGPEPKAIEV